MNRIVAWTVGGVVVTAAVIWFFRVELLRAAGAFLDSSHQPEKCDALFVLSGSPLDRGEFAAELFRRGVAPVVVCTGELPHTTVRRLCGLDYTEAHSTRHVLLAHGVDSSAVRILGVGTSTREECRAIVAYACQQGWRKIGVVSSLFHTRRVGHCLLRQAQSAGLSALVLGAPSSEFDEPFWWRSENGLIFVNNEYMKLLYYAVSE
jgi:uncharacterized SAM-binding protein YcdF (DUF218 family)